MQPDDSDCLRRLDELRHEVDDLRHRIDEACEEERRHEERRLHQRETPDRRIAPPAETDALRMFL
jgi:hypothetical protein